MTYSTMLFALACSLTDLGGGAMEADPTESKSGQTPGSHALPGQGDTDASDPSGGGGGGGGGGVDDSGDNGGDGTGGDTGTASAEPIRFVALGDAGKGDDTQFAVAHAMETVCADLGCDFALYLGDNFYSDGVSAIDDVQFEEKFELPYAGLDFPFHVVAGNHDYGGGGGGYDAWRTDLEVEYTAQSEKWSMPDQFYRFTEGDATFIALDTTALDWGNTDEQAAWLPGELDAASTRWKFAFGHHPFLSNGSHGNANGNFGPFVESNLCDGGVDVYFSGHDHDLMWMESTCPGTEFIVSGGGGASPYSLDGSNPSYYETESNGFMWVEIDGDTFTGIFYDQDANELFRRSFTKS